jgi:hypothetical protein
VTEKMEERERPGWGLPRLLIGFAQMSLAALALGVMIATGVSKLTLLLAVAATGVTLVSRLLYQGWRGPNIR